MPKIKNKVQLPESKLLKAMAELESAIEKGDELEDQDPEGGFSTEGTPLSGAAPRGKSTKKSRGASSSSASTDDASSDGVAKAEDESSIEKMMSASDEASSNDASSKAPPFKKKKSKKVAKAAAASSSSSGDDSASDDESDDSDRPAEKSFRAQAEQDETIGKAIMVNDFLEAFVDQVGVAMARMTKSFAKQLQEAESRINARIDNRVAKSVSYHADFNQRLAKAISSIGNSVQEDVVDVIKSLVNSPASGSRGKAVLSKSEVNNPPWQGNQGGDNRMANGSDGDFSAELADVSQEAIGDWLFKKSMANQIDSKLILAWEADRYSVEALPVQVRKALVNDLCK